MHLVGILDLHAARAAGRHVIVARPALTADGEIEEIENMGRPAIDVGMQLDHCVDVELIVRRARGDRRSLRHTALPVDPFDASPKRTAVALDPFGERMIAPLRLGIVARRQLDRAERFRKKKVGFGSDRAKAVKKRAIHGKSPCI